MPTIRNATEPFNILSACKYAVIGLAHAKIRP